MRIGRKNETETVRSAGLEWPRTRCAQHPESGRWPHANLGGNDETDPTPFFGRGGAPARRQATLLGRISGWCFDHRGKAVGLWLVALLMIFGAAGAAGSRFSTSSSVPDSGSAAGFAVLKEHFPDLGTGGQSGTIVFQARQGVEDPEVKAAMEELFRLVDAGFPGAGGVPLHPGGTVISPYAEGGQGQIARAGPLAGRLLTPR